MLHGFSDWTLLGLLSDMIKGLVAGRRRVYETGPIILLSSKMIEALNTWNTFNLPHKSYGGLYLEFCCSQPCNCLLISRQLT